MLRFALLVAALASAPALATELRRPLHRPGGSPTLSLEERSESAVSGTLVDQNETFTFEGHITIEGLFATLKSPARTLYLMAQFQAGLLFVTLAEPDAAGVPDLRGARTLAFTRK
jgi:hypothetical protein